MFRPHCDHLQANLHKSSALNARTIWDPTVCTIVLYVDENTVKSIYWWIKKININTEDWITAFVFQILPKQREKQWWVL